MSKKGFIHGVGINDMPGMSGSTEYIKWSSMLKRCYSTEWILKYRPTYVGASVCESWLTFSNYYKFYQKNYFEGAVLDKDILFPGNKHYSPDTCVFVPEFINLIVVSNPGKGMFGVTTNKNSYTAKITIEKQTVSLGKFETELRAHQEWQSAKGQHLVCAAEQYKDEYPDNFNQDVYDQLLWKANIIADDMLAGVATYRY
ncbi:hypothetical protein ERHA55_29490 [Erwinia rhapontici]|uniref:Uncharacterized protein n=1 Tax=Erwinia rhapontici TaxID=55212 RepID=A0ABM7N1D1_ERWRD|nr:hypothetical protein [Erwinia rhapontici]BCQ35278.1 hypothetical protein ERHA53_26210 [Erwinia rhapontici]BCQ45422.1 hypothetical protein ERHA55_29490 [Erwinia rhapontici]